MTAIAGALLLVLWFAPTPAHAQLGSNAVGRKPSQYRRATTSPYLDLVNPSRSLEFEFFRRVRPEQEFRSYDRDFARSFQILSRPVPQQTLPQERARAIGTTGHPTSFRSLSTYFRQPVGVGNANIGSR
jgi:hypothetical protein